LFKSFHHRRYKYKNIFYFEFFLRIVIYLELKEKRGIKDRKDDQGPQGMWNYQTLRLIKLSLDQREIQDPWGTRDQKEIKDFVEKLDYLDLKE